MRTDVLSMILGWTLIALSLPLAVSGIATAFLDSVGLALISFAIPSFISLILGITMLTLWTRTNTSERLRDKEAFAAVALVWPLAVFIGCLPFWLGGMFVGPFTEGAALLDIARGGVNSWFESMSGFTTTGATVISHNMSPNCVPGPMDCINAQPRGLLLWRSMIQWFGGMGIIMLGMMLLSRVMGGGMALARAELTGTSLSRLRPKIKQTALALWGLYVFLTLVEFFMLKFIGKLTYFDAINHALTTLPTGGFSTYDANIGHFDSVAVELIIILFMFLAGVNFTLLWMFRDGQGKKALRDEELRYYVFYILIALVIVLIALLLSGEYNGPDALRDSLFQVVSIATSTGYGSADYIPWPVATHIIIFMLMVIGASAGSTGGGLKLMRVILAFKVAMRELVRIAQPRRIDRIRMNGEVVERQQLGLIVGMLFVWIGLFGISTLILAILMPEHSFESIVSIVASSLGNTGPALGEFGPTNTWSGMNSWALILTSMLMWCGRLELLTAVILLHPRTWKKEEKDLTERSAVAMWRKMIPTKDEK